MQSPQPQTIILPQPYTSSPETLTFGIKELDTLLGGLKPGQLVAFHGSWQCHMLSELLCIRSQLHRNEGGLESSVVFIDGGNIFDPYFISENALLCGFTPEELLRNIWVSRAFTGYQMTALIMEELPQILDREGSRFVVVSDITALYCDSDIGFFEAKRTFNRISLFLWNLVRERDIILVATSLSTQHRRKWWLEQYILGRADVAAGFEAGNPHVKVYLEKHPYKPLNSVKLFLGEPNGQSLLENFMRV